MKSKIANRILVGILIVSLVFQVKIPAVYAANSGNIPKVDSITNSVYANGVPLLIEEGSNGKTKIKYYDGNNYVDWMEGNYEYYQVYGGTGFGYVKEPVQSASITMTGGKVSRIYGGGKGKVNVKENVKGDANVTISGGTVALVLCGGDSSSIGGNATITITGGNISTAIQLGGSEYDKIEGNANITITGGTVEKLGKGTYSTILGKKTGIITTTMVDAALFHNGFLKTGDNSYTAKGTITLPSDFDFTLPTGATLTVQEGATIANQGKITLKGTMVNNGTFTNNGTVKNEGGSYSGSGTWNGTAMEDLKLTLSTAKEITDSSAKVAVNCNKDATIYYLASETPISDISILETKGKAQSISANTDCDIALDNLNGNTAYTYYMVAKAGETFTDIKTVSFTTLKKSTNLQLTGTVSGKVFDDTPISHSTTKGDLFTWDSDGIISFTYFTDNTGTKTTAANSGAVSEGAAPKSAGTYYVKATLSDNGGYAGAESDYIPFIIAKANGRITIKNDYKVSYPYTGNTITEPVESQIDKLGDGKVTFQWYDGKNEDGTVTGLTKRETAPVEVGTYTLQGIVAETTNYKSASTTAVVTITEPEYIISAASKDTTGADTNATLTGLGSYVSGTLVTVEASIVSGYNFVGWYQASKEAPGYTGDILSKNHVYKFTISKNTDLVAVYKPLGTASITVNGGNSYTINGSQYTAPNTGTYSLGTNVTVGVSNEKDFAYWVNDYGKVVSRKAAYTFSVTGSMTLTAVYNKKVENKSTVIFESYYGQVMSRMQLGSGDTVTLPKGPTRYGYTFIKWSMTAEEIQKGIKENTAVIRVTPVYKLINQSYTIKVTGGAGSRNYNLNDLVTATANAPEAGKKFSHWTDADGNILSYSTTYQFYAAKDATIIANYVADTTVVEAKGTAEIINIDKDTEKSKIIFVSMVTVPEGCKIQMAGIIGTNNKAVGTSGDGFNKDTAAYVRGNAWSGNAYRFTWTKKVSADETWYVRAYLVYKDTNGNLITVYGDMITAKL